MSIICLKNFIENFNSFYMKCVVFPNFVNNFS